MARNILTMLLGNLPKPETSYNSTQGHILKAMLAETGVECEVPYIEEIPDIGPEDTIYLYLGFGYSPESTDINVFGGMKNCGQFTCDHLTWLSQHKGEIISLEHPMPDYATIVKNKLSGLDQIQMERWKGVDLEHMATWGRFGWLLFPNRTVCNNMVIGDSHAYTLYRPGYMVNSVPHKTLFGALKTGLIEFVLPAVEVGGYLDNIDIIFGNIDIRHHLARQESPRDSVSDLARATIAEMHTLHRQTGATINFYELLPIENESRKLSKSGWFKGTPYFGTWLARRGMRDYFNIILKEALKNDDTCNFIEWTGYLMNDKRELCFTKMEKPRGVHISGANFPYWKRDQEQAASLDSIFG